MVSPNCHVVRNQWSTLMVGKGVVLVILIIIIIIMLAWCWDGNKKRWKREEKNDERSAKTRFGGRCVVGEKIELDRRDGKVWGW